MIRKPRLFQQSDNQFMGKNSEVSVVNFAFVCSLNRLCKKKMSYRLFVKLEKKNDETKSWFNDKCQVIN